VYGTPEQFRETLITSLAVSLATKFWLTVFKSLICSEKCKKPCHQCIKLNAILVADNSVDVFLLMWMSNH